VKDNGGSRVSRRKGERERSDMAGMRGMKGREDGGRGGRKKSYRLKGLTTQGKRGRP